MFRRTGAIIVLVGLYFLAAQIGNSFGQALTIFSVFMWAIAGGMFVYLMLFKGMRLSLFANKVANDNFEDDLTGGEEEMTSQERADEIVENGNVRQLPAAE